MQTIHHGWGSCLSIFFPYLVFFFISSSHSNKLTEKPNQIHHKQAIKKHNFSCTFGSFPNQSLPCFPVTGSRTKREMQTGGETAGGERDKNWEWGADPWGLAFLPSCPLNLWCCPASSENRGMARENQERIGEEKDSRERTTMREQPRENWVYRRGNPGEWGEWQGNLRNRMRGMTGERGETKWQWNERRMRGNEGKPNELGNERGN